MEVIDVVDLSERNDDGTPKYTVDMKYYNKMISTLPYESVTPVSILNIMLEQVSFVCRIIINIILSYETLDY